MEEPEGCPKCGLVYVKLYSGHTGCAIHGPEVDAFRGKSPAVGHPFFGNQHVAGVNYSSHDFSVGHHHPGGAADNADAIHEELHSHADQSVREADKLKAHLEQDHRHKTDDMNYDQMVTAHWHAPHATEHRGTDAPDCPKCGLIMVKLYSGKLGCAVHGDEEKLFGMGHVAQQEHLYAAHTAAQNYTGSPTGNVNQPRDSHGRWTTGDGSDPLPTSNPMVTGGGNAHSHGANNPTPPTVEGLRKHMYSGHGTYTGDRPIEGVVKEHTHYHKASN